ncbi:pentapeptide repeat-containing protein [Pseudotenacibaculum sp. MALMAid0570]|uniref:pentapeptide repeat-containing protein n=1 Tax=Pseudotenacibaculum sp. MALMAid0570 TaxID=3143938 RepID=UPI0032DFD944
MKNKITLLTLIFTLVSFVGFSQKTVNASDIIKDIKAGKDVSINNAIIEGVLDFTYMDEKLEDLPKRKKRWWKGNNGDNKVKNLIETKISFVNCTFKDDVLAYIPDSDDSGYTFVASFEDDAIFKDCVFQRKAMFKYSYFENESSFENADFQDDTTFKYSKFKKTASFKNTNFENGATFKYANFANFISFANSTFKETTTFKYTKFNDGVSFKDVRFEEDLNIKYTEVHGKFDISGMKVAYDIDSKYTKINGKSFSRYLLNRN